MEYARNKCLWLVFLIGMSSCIVSQPVYLFVEGNVGAGKSTLLNIIKKHLDVVVVSEPCDQWQDIEGYNLLDAFYSDSARWACTFQLYAFMTRIKKQKEYAKLGGAFQIMERSWFSDKYCFALNAFESNLLDQMEWNLYCNMWTWYVDQGIAPSGLIYLRADPAICYERMQIRARSEESVVPLEYLEALHKCHEQWLMEQKYSSEEFGNIPVLVLDGSLDFQNNDEVQQDFIRQILDFLNINENIDFTV